MKAFTVILSTLAVAAMATPVANPETITKAIELDSGVLERSQIEKRQSCGACSGGTKVCWVSWRGYYHYYTNSC
ncbi:hypothetical protein ACHAQA_000055 [Verticillium albo-atrum]